MFARIELEEEVRLTVGELREMLDWLPEGMEISFEAPDGPRQFHRLMGRGEKTVVVQLRELGPQVECFESPPAELLLRIH